MIETKGDFPGSAFNVTAKWILFEDGIILTVNSHFSSSMGEGKTKVVFEKQEHKGSP